MKLLLLIFCGIAKTWAHMELIINDAFYEAIVSTFPDQNIIFSAEMIRSSMLYIYVGVENTGSNQIEESLHFQGLKLSDYKPDSEKILNMLWQDNPVAKSMTRFFVEQSLKMSNEYRMFMRHTEGKAQNIAFNTEKLKEVNEFYKREMGEQMGEVIKESYWKPDNMGLLVNAMYFNLSWERTFNPGATYDREFRVSSQRTINVPMMHEDSKFAFGDLEKLQATALLLPFSQGNLSMLLVKPNQPDGLSDLEKQLSKLDIHDLTTGLSMAEVFVGIPKFHVRCDLELRPALEKIGIKQIFVGSKSFSTLLQRNAPFQISGVRHVVSFEFQEQGIGPPPTEVGNGSLTHTFNEVKYFLLTHPFAFYIIDKESTFFAGHVTTF
ncbi:hypothetical protein KR067_002699 [Drosophila pandora]|nr:hypothetical protein KR067_002699 [Drosophila pandora]